MSLNLKEGAFVVSDAHYSANKPIFLEFLKDIDSKKLQPTQLIFMGDIFDALFGGVSRTISKNEEAIAILKNISLHVEVIYLEGNHDFNLKKVFKNIKIFPITKQPVSLIYEDKKILLAHGDIQSPLGYKIYTALIRNPFLLFFLNILNQLFGYFITNSVEKHLSKKDDCGEMYSFKEYIGRRLLNKYSCDYFIEGHFHQNKTINYDDFIYINLGVFACNQRYFIVKSSKEELLLQEQTF